MLDALWILAFMTDGGEDHVDWVVESNFIPKLVEILQTKVHKQIKPALNIIKNVMRYPKYRVRPRLSFNV